MTSKKKNWFEKIIENDAKQQAAMYKQNMLKIKKNTANNRSDRKDVEAIGLPKTTITILAVLLPIVGYVLGVGVNPKGHLSNDPSFLVFIPLLFWPISILFVLVFIFLIATRKLNAALLFVFTTSLIYSIFTYSAVASASENEFTD